MSMFSQTHVYHQREHAISLDEIEELVSEFTDEKKRYIEILTERLVEKGKQRKAQNFGPVQAREIVLRLIVKTEGNILL